MGLSVVEVADKKSFKDFLHLPYHLYKNDPVWVPPLLVEEKKLFNRKIHPFLQNNDTCFFVCYQDGLPLGRVVAIINREHNSFYKKNVGFFGFFESTNSYPVANELFRAAQNWLLKRDIHVIRGPVNYSLNEVSALLIEGFDDPPFIMMPYNPPYYKDLLKQNGFQTTKTLYAYEVTKESLKLNLNLEKLENRLKQHGITVRNIDYDHLESDAKNIQCIFNSAWNENWGYVPLTADEVDYSLKKMKEFAKPELVFIAEAKGQPVGFSLSLPDINQALKPLKGRLFPFNWLWLLINLRKINQIRVMLMGVIKEFRNKGIDLLFYLKTIQNGIRMNYQRAEMSWILEDNLPMNQILEHINARKYKTYVMYEKKL